MSNKPLSPHIARLVAEAKARHEARIANQAITPTAVSNAVFQSTLFKQPAAPAPGTVAKLSDIPPVAAAASPVRNENTLTAAKYGDVNLTPSLVGFVWNARQGEALELGIRGSSFCLIGAAGTGKTTTTQELISRVQQSSHMATLSENTKHLSKGAPAMVIVGFTNKAVNNIRRKLPKHLQGHCLTVHKTIEFGPVWYEDTDDNGNIVKTMRFEPFRNSANPLPHISVVIVEEASMVGTDLWNQFIDALPNPAKTQFIILGDLNQIPPVFGPSILGFAMTELPVVELDTVYRQALLSPIISLATAVRTNRVDKGFHTSAWYEHEEMCVPNKLTEKLTIDRGQHGKLTIHPWKKRVDNDTAIAFMRHWLPLAIDNGTYVPDEDQILCPFNVSYGTVELNNIIADHLAKKRGAVVHEVIARYKKSYYAVGDRVLVDRQAATISKIESNPAYVGKVPVKATKTLDRWGRDPENPTGPKSAADVFAMLDKLETASDEDKARNSASHKVYAVLDDTGYEVELSTAGEINTMIFAYALTIHKSQGSEWQRVFLFLHASHSSMCSRELIYTAITRAKHELYIICEGDNAGKANQMASSAKRPEIPGTTLKEKIAFFQQKAKEMSKSSDADHKFFDFDF